MCDARMRPFTDDTTVDCEVDGDHAKHRGIVRDYAYPGSATAIEWMEDDRRTFRGDWVPCPHAGCILPALHRGNHAQ